MGEETLPKKVGPVKGVWPPKYLSFAKMLEQRPMNTEGEAKTYHAKTILTKKGVMGRSESL